MYRIFFLIGIFICHPCLAHAKDTDDQDQIILLNDSASAVEDSDPGLSKSLAALADAKEKEWENKNANKNVDPVPITDKDRPVLQEEIQLLNKAALEIKPVYPLIAQGLHKMAKEINRSIEIEK